MDYIGGKTTADTNQLDPMNVTNEPYELFDLALDDTKLYQALVQELPRDVDYWNNGPWELEETDRENINYLLGKQLDDKRFLDHQIKYVDNRLFSSVRAIVAYVTGQQTKPEIIPSKTDDKYVRIAKQMEQGIYQHALNNKVNTKFRLALKNLIVRKRGVLKLRFDENVGPFGDIVTENIDPSDVVIDRFACYGEDPGRIYHRQRCTIEALVAKFPDKKDDIFKFYGFKRGVATQLSRIVTYYECWFTYYDNTDRKQGLAWFVPESTVVLGKMSNPNWITKGSVKQQKIANLTSEPIKPFIWLNYLNTGRSYIDETCLFDQAKPQQDLLNKRGRQIWENADYSNPRTLVDKRVMDEGDANKFVNKHPKTIGLVNTTDTGNDINKAVLQIPAQMLPEYVVQTLFDSRTEIDTMMGTPAIFRGEQSPGGVRTVGQSVLMKQQANALQGDLVVVVNEGYTTYYTYLLQMMRVYLTDDYWILTKGRNSQYIPILLNSDNIDTNVRVQVRIDSSLPMDKNDRHNTALNLATAGLIDPLSLYRDLGYDDAEERAELLQTFMLDKVRYQKSIEQDLYNQQADADITMLIANKVPAERDDYDKDYLDHFNLFITRNEFQMLPAATQTRLTNFLHEVANKAAMTAALQTSIVGPAGIVEAATAPTTNPDGTPIQPGQVPGQGQPSAPGDTAPPPHGQPGMQQVPGQVSLPGGVPARV